MPLKKYNAKRNFEHTPEPAGDIPKARSKKLAFVVQEHHASRLHYDFRLELDGVLKSWAVPKGPSLDPHEHHLAVMVEDHPYDYRKFEGVIPEGNYGAGNVIIWDEGWYEPRTPTADPQKTLRVALKKGHITFILHGKKLHGEFALIKMAHMDPNAWLLIKKGDEFAETRDITQQDTSVKTGRKVDDLPGSKRLPDLTTYPRIAKPWHVHPMLCTLVDEIFDKIDWLFEIKWDGFRAIGAKHGADVQLYSRNSNDFITHYPPVAEALRELKYDVILDGEIVVTDADGRPHFELLQNWRRNPQGHLQYFIFDILWCNGHDVRAMPLIERKKLLKTVLPKSSVLRYSDDVVGKGTALFAEMERRGLEGVVAKQADSPYRENDRGAAWLKIKTHLRQEVVICGYTEPRGSRTYIGSLIVGLYNRGELTYVGHSGGGIPDGQREALLRSLQKIERKKPPFDSLANLPKPDTPVHWVQPKLVCEMTFSEWTSESIMRQPQFKGLRADKKPTDVHRERPKHAAPKNAQKKETVMPQDKLELTHLDKIFFPKHSYTKGQLMDYYRAVAPVMLPYLKDRPHSLNRFPDGITGFSFFQKNNEHLPGWVTHADIFSDSNNANLRWIVGNDLDTLLYMVQLGAIEINPWNSRVKHLNNPDWLVVDLDPEGRTFTDVIKVARTVKQVCDDFGIPSYPKTSGKTGIHIYVPLAAKYTYEQAKDFAHLIVIEANKRQPDLTSLERMPDKRKHKIYLDFLQNREGQTLAAPYSVRPTPDATVSTPLHWDEVTPKLRPTDFTIKNMPARIKKVGDLWAPVMGKGIVMTTALKKIQASD